MSAPNPSTALAKALIDELARNGAGFAVISPGSRSTALAVAASAHPAMTTAVLLDERSAAFLALGRAKATGAPTVLISTSGTAPANYFPALIEAEMSGTPLIVLSADRPAELRGVGANQTIDQVELFGGHVRWFADVAAAEDGDDLNALWREAACRAAWAAAGVSGPPGPAHLNIAFREPTVPVSDDGRSSADAYLHSIEGREGDEPWSAVDDGVPAAAIPELAPMSKTMVIAGDGAYGRDALREEVERRGWPLLATAASGMRGIGATINRYHHILASGVPPDLRPETVVAIGAIGPSQRLEDLVATARVRVRVDAWGRVVDPGRNSTHLVRADPFALISSMETGEADQVWGGLWARAEAKVASAVDDCIGGLDEPTGAMAAKALDQVGWGALVAASSLPVREVDAHLGRAGPVIGNRGASGIDGFVSTARGVGSAVPRTLALSGDLSMLHDSNGLLGDDIGDAVFVVLDNDGGGLFDSLPQHRHAPDYERLFIAPQNRSLRDLARFHRIAYDEAINPGSLVSRAGQALDAGGVTLIRVPVERHFDLESRRRLDEVALEALTGLEA